MEEIKKEEPLTFQQQLQSIEQLQEQIERTKKELSQLGKLQLYQDKHLHHIYQQSLITTRNKLNAAQTQEHIDQLHQLQNQEVRAKQEKVKELREKHEKHLKEVRQMLKKSRQHERLVIRNNSIRYDQTITKNKKLELQLKERMVKEARRDKENYKQSMADSRMQETKRKEVQMFRQTLARIQRQPSMVKQLENLLKQKQIAQSKLQQRQSLKRQIGGSLEKLKKMKVNEVREIIKEQNRMSLEDQKIERQRKLLGKIQSIDQLRSVLMERKPDLKLRIM